MALAVDVIDRHGPSSEMHCQLKLKNNNNAVLSVYITAKFVLPALQTTKMEHFSFKSGCVEWVENDEMHCQL